MSQKIIIPKGLINPNETTIIEIPEEVQDVETVVAKPLYTDDSCCAEEIFENEYPVEESKFEYLEEFGDGGREKKAESIGVRATNSYPIYKYHKRRVYGDETSYTYSNTICKPFVNDSLEETDVYFSSNPAIDSKRGGKLTAKEVVSILDILEKVELKRLYKNLRNYQSARRKLLFETANVHTFDDICASLYGLY